MGRWLTLAPRRTREPVTTVAGARVVDVDDATSRAADRMGRGRRPSDEDVEGRARQRQLLDAAAGKVGRRRRMVGSSKSAD